VIQFVRLRCAFVFHRQLFTFYRSRPDLWRIRKSFYNPAIQMVHPQFGVK